MEAWKSKTHVIWCEDNWGHTEILATAPNYKEAVEWMREYEQSEEHLSNKRLGYEVYAEDFHMVGEEN